MQKKSRHFLIEFLWLTLSLGLTTLFMLLLFGQPFLSGELDLHLHDTYFVIERWLILTPLFSLTTFIIFLVRTYKKKFNVTLSNLILFLSGLTLVIFLTILIRTFSEFAFSYGTLYPPLSALGPNQVTELNKDSTTMFIANFLTVIQAILLLLLAFVTFRWGRQKGNVSSKQ